ncbi:MAG: glycosyltransferase family 2 protein [Flavobacteriales bacterium]|nr:glycosyltransferase family 2 protein [Flavobacteriales bacterium]
MELSVVIITFNEERNIARCITSVKQVADEVIVVDSGSTDNTVQIAKEHGAQVTHRDWTNYSDQKNFANGLATGRYILSLDADESVSEQLRHSILEARHAGLHGAYSMARLTNYCGTWVRHGGWYPDIKVRLFPKEKARWKGEHVHETLQLDLGVGTTLLKGDLLHYSFYSVEQHERQAEHFAGLAAKAMHARNKRSSRLRIIFSPVSRFVQGYFFRGGFLDGGAGFTIARISARAKRLKYTELARLNREGA